MLALMSPPDDRFGGRLPVFPLRTFKFGDLRLRLGIPEAEVTDQVLTVTVAGRFRPAEIASPGDADGLAFVDVGRPVRPWLRPEDHEQNIGGLAKSRVETMNRETHRPTAIPPPVAPYRA